MSDLFWPIAVIGLPVGFVWGITANYVLKTKWPVNLGVGISAQCLALLLTAILVLGAPHGVNG